MNSRFTDKAQEALDSTLSFARQMGHTYVGTEHILLGLLSCEGSIAYRILKDHGVELTGIKEQITKTVGTGSPSGVGASEMTPMTKRIIEESAYTASRLGATKIGTEHLLAAIISESECYANKMIRGTRASVSDIRNELSRSFGTPSRNDGPATKGQRKEKESIPGCPTLSKYGQDLCRLAKEGAIDPIIGREAQTDRLIQILSRRTKNNPCLIGEPGVGKTAVVEGLARRICEGAVPEGLKNKIIVTLDISSMIAGAKYRGEFEERMKNVMEEVAGDLRVILFVDEVHTIIGAGGAEGAIDAANIIKPALARGHMQLIGATTVEEYRKYIEKDAALERRFQSVTVGEPTPDETVQILFGLREKYEEHHKVKISDEAIRAAVSLSVRYVGDRYLPDKAIDLIDEAAAKLCIKGYMPTREVLELEKKLKTTNAEKEKAILGEDFEKAAALRDLEKKLEAELAGAREQKHKNKTATVGPEDIEDIVTERTGIPVHKLCREEGERLLNLHNSLMEEVIGQDAAVEAVARAVRRGRTGLKDPKRPIGSFIFLGPTGVGKTHLTKALARSVFGDERAMIRLDMSEYMERHSVSRLIGAPPGYVGYEDAGQLTEKVRRSPYSVVLFDEIEKAHPDVFNILLQILDDGTLTDTRGRRVDFSNTVIVMTSNVGAGSITSQHPLGFFEASAKQENIQSRAKEALRGTFRPEFLNRVDEIIVFRQLSEEDVKKIAQLMLLDVKKRIEAQGINVTFSAEVAEFIAQKGYDPVYGARPLRRCLVRLVEDSFSNAMLSGTVSKGDSVIASLKDGNVVFEKEQA